MLRVPGGSVAEMLEESRRAGRLGVLPVARARELLGAVVS